MSLLTLLALSVVTVAAALTFLLRVFSWRRILRFHVVVDLLFTALAFSIFSGTLTGALVAATAGLALSLTLSAGRAASRFYNRLDPRGTKANP